MTPSQLFLQQNPGVDLTSPQGQAQLQAWLNSPAGQTASSAQSQTGTNTGLNLGSLVGSPNPASATSGLNTAIGGATTGGNTDQLQGSQQSGAFSSTGTTGTTGATTQQGVQQGQTTGSQQQTGQTSTTGQQATQGNVATSGTTTAIDALGLGSLLSGQAGNAANATGTAQNFLEGVTQGNNPLLQAQTSNAVNTALSGPGMVGTGMGAQARAAGDAAANVGLNSQAQQISAATGLGSPTAATTLANAGNAYVGQSTSGNQATSGLTDTSGSTLSAQDLSTLSNSLNLSSLLGTSSTNTNEAQQGTSAANSTQEAIGQVPQSQTSSGSGCYVCTAIYERNPKQSLKSAITRAARWKLARWSIYGLSLSGYSVYGPVLAKYQHYVPGLSWVAKSILWHECSLACPKRYRYHFVAHWFHTVFHYGSVLCALFTGKRDMQTSEATIAFLKRNGLLFHG